MIDERLFSTGNDELDDILEEVYYSGIEDGYDYFQKEFAKKEEDDEELNERANRAGWLTGLGVAGGGGLIALSKQEKRDRSARLRRDLDRVEAGNNYISSRKRLARDLENRLEDINYNTNRKWRQLSRDMHGMSRDDVHDRVNDIVKQRRRDITSTTLENKFDVRDATRRYEKNIGTIESGYKNRIGSNAKAARRGALLAAGIGVGAGLAAKAIVKRRGRKRED